MRLILFIFITICVISSNTTADNVTYTYDDAGRLTKADYGGGKTITYTYGKSGNMLEKKVVTAAATDPVPDVKANGSDGPVTVTQGTNLTVIVSIDPGNHTGENADWWVYATSPFGTYWYTLNSGWLPSETLIRVHGRPLFNLSPYTVLDMSTLPVGDYNFNFAVDGNMDNIRDATYLDSELVTIQ